MGQTFSFYFAGNTREAQLTATQETHTTVTLEDTVKDMDVVILELQAWMDALENLKDKSIVPKWEDEEETKKQYRKLSDILYRLRDAYKVARDLKDPNLHSVLSVDIPIQRTSCDEYIYVIGSYRMVAEFKDVSTEKWLRRLLDHDYNAHFSMELSLNPSKKAKLMESHERIYDADIIEKNPLCGEKGRHHCIVKQIFAHTSLWDRIERGKFQVWVQGIMFNPEKKRKYIVRGQFTALMRLIHDAELFLDVEALQKEFPGDYFWSDIPATTHAFLDKLDLY